MTRGAPWLVVLATLPACGGGTAEQAAGSDASFDAPIADDALDAADGADATDAEVGPPPHVEIRDGSLRIDGVETFLYGGDLHYFRVRDPGLDAQKTWALWASTIDQMRAAGMNLVTTYLPWDWHSPAAGTYDFTGPRDLGRFLQTACGKGMHVVVKPGPLITGEWPKGFGSFGAVPQWFKSAHPEALVRKANGDLYSFSPTGDASQQQPSYLHPAYLAAAKDWYDHVLPVVKPYLGNCLIGVQIDNETNGYWGARYGDVDYSTTSLAHYRAWLAKKYVDVATLNAAYGSSYASFDGVVPPTSPPGSGAAERPKNRWYADWYDAGQAYTKDYLAILKGWLGDAGFAPPAVLHLTNDSPFALLADDVLLHAVLLHDGPSKNAIGLAGLDLYPKQSPTNSNLQDQPFQADYFTRLYDRYDDAYTGPQTFAYAAELQGGFYALPIVGHPSVRPEATDQLLARTIGHGLKSGSFYVIRDGLNADGSAYDYQAAIAADGTTTARYPVMKRWGAMLAAETPRLLHAEEVSSPVLVLANGRYAAPRGGILDDLQRLTTIETTGVYGWLEAAGVDPDVDDARLVSAGDLAHYKEIFYLNPDFVDDATATLLDGFVRGGGVLVNLAWPGRVNDDFVASPATNELSQVLFPASDAGYWVWPTASRSGDFHVKTPTGAPDAPLDAIDATMTSVWYESFWTPTSSAATPFAWEKTAPFGTDGRVVGYVVSDAVGTRAFLGTYVSTRFSQNDYYTLADADLAHAISLARDLVGLAGVTPIVTAGRPRELSWARRAADATYLFVVNDNGASATVHLTLADPARLGLDPSRRYRVREALSATTLVDDVAEGALAAAGIDVPVAALSTAVVVVEAR